MASFAAPGAEPPTVAYVEQVILAIYNTSNENERRNANLWINEFTASPHMWKTCLELIQSNAKGVQFFVSNLIYTKICKEWLILLDNNIKLTLHGELSKILLEFTRNDAISYADNTIRRICLALGAIAILTPNSIQAFINDIVKPILEIGFNATNDIISKQNQLDMNARAKLGLKSERSFFICCELLIAIPEEKNGISDLAEARKEELNEECRAVSSEVLNIIQLLVVNANIVQVHDKFQIRGLDVLKNWASLGISTLAKLNTPTHAELFQTLLTLLSNANEDKVHAASEALIALCEVREYPDNTNEMMNAQDIVMACLMNAHSRFSQTANNPDDVVAAHAICKAASCVGELCLERIVSPGSNHLAFIDFLLTCTNHSDRLVARHMLDFWLAFSDIPMASRDPSLRAVGGQIYPRLTEVLIKQCTLNADVSSAEDIDYDVQNFRDSSDGVKDILIVLWHASKAQLIAQLLAVLNTAVRAGQWPVAESVLFIFTSISRDVREFIVAGRSAGPQLQPVKQSIQTLLLEVPSLLSHSAHPILLGACAHLVGSYAAVYSKLGREVKQQLVERAFQCIMPSLLCTDANVRKLAAESIQRVCASCANEIAAFDVASGVGQLSSQLERAVEMGLQLDARLEAVQGLTRVVCAMEGAQVAGEAIEVIVTPWLNRVAGEVSFPTGSKAADVASAELDALTVVLKFLEGSWEAAEHPVAVLLRRIWPFLETVAVNSNGRSPAVTQSLYALFAVSFSAANQAMAPQLATVLNTALTEFGASNSVHCLRCVERAVETYGETPGDIQSSFAGLLQQLSVHLFNAVKSGETVQHPEILHAFFDMLFRYFVYCPVALFHDVASFAQLLELAIVCVTLQERDSVRSVLNYVDALVARTEDPYRKVLSEVLYAVDPSSPDTPCMGRRLVQQLVNGVATLSPSILVPNIAKVIHSLVKNYHEAMSQWTYTSLAAPEFSCTSLHNDAKQQVLALLLNQQLAAQDRRYKSLVADFSKLCRGESTPEVLLSYVL